MGSKRRFKDVDYELNECSSSEINQNGSSVNNKKFIGDYEVNLVLNSNNNNDNLNQHPIEHQIEPENTTQSNTVESVDLIVKDLVCELVKSTENDLNKELIEYNKLTNSFKLNYDFGNCLIGNSSEYTNDALFNVNSFTEHNYANVVPSTSSSSLSSINRPIKGALKFNNSNNSIKKSTNKRNVKFKGVTVFYFGRNQGGSCIPSQGGSTLGMEMNHCDLKNFTLDDHQEEKRQAHREILLRQKRYEKMYQKQQQQQARTSNSMNQNRSDSDDDSLDNISDISDSELEFDSWYFLQPVPVKQRRALLRDAGINKIDSTEKEECRDIRSSRETCGCDCTTYCDPETCLCSLAGIKCQVDRLNFPCGCGRGSCGNLNGRIEFNPLRVRTHFMHTIMRLELEKNNENQQFSNNETTQQFSNDHPYHLKTNHNNNNHNDSNTQNSTNIELVQSTSQQQQQTNDLYTTINCNEVNLENFNYNEFYDSTDSNTYSESSECTSEELDCRLTTTIADNQTTLNGLNSLNGLTFNLTPFQLISNVPMDAIGTYDTNNSQIFQTNDNFLPDQSFRYYTSSSNHNSTNLALPIIQQQQIDQNILTTTNDQQLINHLHYQTYYHDTLYNSNNPLATINTPTATITSNNLANDTGTDSQLSITIDQNNFAIEPQHHYTDLSQSIASKSVESPINLLNSANVVCPVLISTTTANDSQSLNSNEFNSIVLKQIESEEEVHHHGTILNSSSDDSSSGQSTQNEEEDNFGELIKNTIVESVIANVTA